MLDCARGEGQGTHQRSKWAGRPADLQRERTSGLLVVGRRSSLSLRILADQENDTDSQYSTRHTPAATATEKPRRGMLKTGTRACLNRWRWSTRRPKSHPLPSPSLTRVAQSPSTLPMTVALTPLNSDWKAKVGTDLLVCQSLLRLVAGRVVQRDLPSGLAAAAAAAGCSGPRRFLRQTWCWARRGVRMGGVKRDDAG